MASKFMTALGLGVVLAAGLPLAPTAFAKDWKAVVIGMEGAYEPWNLTDSSGKIVGFEVDLANDVCKRAGLECKVIAQDWDGMIPGLKAGKFDVIMDGMSITDERKKEIDISTRTPPLAMPQSRACRRR
jgi:octopine/nopaline transport system substrate-binding protein